MSYLYNYFKSKMSYHCGPEKYQNVLRIFLNGPRPFSSNMCDDGVAKTIQIKFGFNLSKLLF